MTSWTNATDRTEPDGLGDVVHPRHVDSLIDRVRLDVTDPTLRLYADRFWAVRWARHGQPVESTEVITNPVCHLTFESGENADGGPLVRHGVELPASVITTVWTRRFVVRLEGSGRAFGIRFLPGALPAILGRALLANQSLRVQDYFAGVREAERAVLAEPDDETRRDLVQSWLTRQLPDAVDPSFTLVNRIIERVRVDETIVRVEQIGDLEGLSTRALQRLLRHYLGVPPKWVLMRCRLQDAAACLDRAPHTELSGLATRLGWYDQSHFVRDFRRFLGVTPGQYARDAASSVVGSPSSPG